jgi:hypothetical protein
MNPEYRLSNHALRALSTGTPAPRLEPIEVCL